MATATGRLEWIDDRWHLDGRGIHAGSFIAIRWPDGFWQEVRVESDCCGRILFAHFKYHGVGMGVRIVDSDGCEYELRWSD